MFALIFRFPTGHYHATPWGRNVNEGAVAWPPEPYRVLRALIAVWHRKANQARWDTAALHRLIEALAEMNPVYRLPAAVHAHTRHYMPQGYLQNGRESTSLVFDAFFRIDADDELVVAWPELTLDTQTYALAEHLASLIGYLGRAESTVTASAAHAVGGDFPVQPVAQATEAAPGWTTMDVLTPLSPKEYSAVQPTMLALNRDKARSKRRTTFEATVPATLTDALQVETSQLQSTGWSRPPAGRMVAYLRPEVGPRPQVRTRPRREPKDQDAPTVARLILAGRPRPPITDAVRIGEVFRHALMARVSGPISPILCGRDENGAPLRVPDHDHAFFLPEDDDLDGHIDHLVLYARGGLDRTVRDAVESLRMLWARDGADDEGKREWRLALEGFGTPEHFRDSDLLRRSATWISVTPYLRPWHSKGDPQTETCNMVRRECLKRGLPIAAVVFDGPLARCGREIQTAAGARSVLHFHRFRSRRGLIQPDRSGSAIRLMFDPPITGPVALGFGCHFGLGLFRAADDPSVYAGSSVHGNGPGSP